MDDRGVGSHPADAYADGGRSLLRNAVDGTLATARLLEISEKLMPPAGAGDETLIVSVAWLPTRFIGFGVSVIPIKPAEIVRVAGLLLVYPSLTINWAT